MNLAEVGAHLAATEHVHDVHDPHVWTVTSSLEVMAGAAGRAGLAPAAALFRSLGDPARLAAFEVPAPLCPFIAAAVEIRDPQHPARQCARDYKKAFAARLAETAREAGAANPEQLGEQLALLLDGASARTRVLNTETLPTAAVLIDNAIPTAAQR
jgi:hypothetical protein